MSTTVPKELALPLRWNWIQNEGDYGDGGPDCRSGFRSPIISDANGQTILDTLNSDGAMVEEEYDSDEETSWSDAWDVPGRKRGQRVILATGIRHSESKRRMRYGTREVNTRGSQVWCNPIYWWSAEQRDAYKAAHNLPRNPTSELLGMSGECLCGAFAYPGELAMVKLACPITHARIQRLQAEVAEAYPWGWEGRPPKGWRTVKPNIERRPLCVGCEKIHSAKETP